MNRYVVFDLETTGFSHNTDEIIEIGAWKVEDGIPVDEFSTLVKPSRGIPYNIQRITRITSDMVKDEPDISEVITGFYEFCEGYPILGYNLPFDYRFMKATCERFSLDFTERGLRSGIDTYSLARKFYSLERNKLEDLVEYFCLETLGGKAGKCGEFHRARYDAYMTHLVYQCILGEYPEIIEVNTPYLLEEKGKRVREVGNCDSMDFK